MPVAGSQEAPWLHSHCNMQEGPQKPAGQANEHAGPPKPGSQAQTFGSVHTPLLHAGSHTGTHVSLALCVYPSQHSFTYFVIILGTFR